MNTSNHPNPGRTDLRSAMTAGLTVAQGLLDAAIPLTPQQLCDLRNQARLRLEAGQHEQARELCRQILHRDPHDAEAVRLLGRCSFDLSEFSPPPLRVSRPEVFLPTPPSSAPLEFQLPELALNLRKTCQESPH